VSDEYSVFLDTELGFGEVAGQLLELLGGRLVAESSGRDDEVGLRVRAADGEGWLDVLVHRNWHVLVDAEPGEAQAIDPYGVQVDVSYGGGDEEREAREVFERLVGAAIPMLLVHDVTYLVGAHLPGVGTHYFDAGVSMDEPDLAHWRDWVTEVRAT
jgi:hypothetical protein